MNAVAVTGGSGYVGGLLAAALLARTPHRLVLPLRPHRVPERIAQDIAAELRLGYGLTDPERLERLDFVELPPLDAVETLEGPLRGLGVGRIVHALTSAKKVQDLVHKHAKAAIKLDKDVTKEMARLVHHAEFTQQYLQKFLRDRTLSAQDLTEFYYAADAKAAWKADQSLLDDLIKQAQQ